MTIVLPANLAIFALNPFRLIIIFLFLVVFLGTSGAFVPDVFLKQYKSMFRLRKHTFNGSLTHSSGKPVSFGVLSHVQWRDRSRLRHLLVKDSKLPSGPVSFPLGGIANPNMAGLYFTEISLGTPPSKYYVQIDTGSDLLWVNCANCNSCPRKTDLGVHLALYDPSSSSTSSTVMCGDSYCQNALSGCLAEEACGYQLGYGDGSSSEGFFVRDLLQLNIVAPGNKSVNRGAEVSFGCGTRESGGLHSSDQALDGILGLGQSSVSVLSQLRSNNEISGVFAHCLEGVGKGGGILVIGDVTAPGVVFTPIIRNQPHYNVNLNSITINDISIPIDSSASKDGGTIVDSGTTLAYFSDAAYIPLLQVIHDAVKIKTHSFEWQGMSCISYSGSNVEDLFPSINLNFDGGSSMTIRPHDYVIQAEGAQGHGWCIGFQSTGSSSLNLNILGDLVLKDKLIIYDLEQQRIGWVDYDCTSNVTVLAANGLETSVPFISIPIGSGTRRIFKPSLLEHSKLAIFLFLVAFLPSFNLGF